MNQKGLAPILIIILITLVIGGFLYTIYSKNQTSAIPSSSFSKDQINEQASSLPKITKDQAVENVKKIPEVKIYLAKAPKGIVEVGKKSNINAKKSNDNYLVHVYEKFADHQETFHWYFVDIERGDVSSAISASDSSDKKFLKFNKFYSLPAGWDVELEFSDSIVVEGNYESLNLKKGGYSLNTGIQDSGRANCVGNKDIENFAVLNNKNLGGSKVIREKIPVKTIDPNMVEINICSDFVEPNLFDYGTKFGLITYYLPKNWDPEILQEMDSIVESFR